MSTLYVMESANLICGQQNAGGTQPGVSTHLKILGLKLPALENSYTDVYPGGAPVGVEVPLYQNRYEATFTLAGWDDAVLKMMNNPGWQFQWFTAYGVIRDRRSGQALQARAQMQGEMGRANPTEYRKGDLHQWEFSIRAIVHYELYMQTDPEDAYGWSAGAEIYFWDFFAQERRIGGYDLNAVENSLLHIWGGAVEAPPG